MIHKIKNLLLLFSVLLTLGCNGQQAEEKASKKVAAIPYDQVDTRSNDQVHMMDAEGNYVGMTDLMESYKGKVVYLDIWASWCGPCKAMMPSSHRLQQKFDGKDVVFLYVSIDRNKEAWKRSAQQFRLDENSFLARNYPKAQLFQKHNVRTIPRYMLFDKTGRLIDGNAHRPNVKTLEDNINALLTL